MNSALQNLLSFFYELPIEKKSSSINPSLEVTYHKGNYKLATRNAIYSFGTQYTVFADAFRILKIPSRNIPTVLCLGFGLGSIPVIIEKKNSNSVQHYVGVEIDPVIIELAKKYLNKNILQKTEIICSDAFNFINNCERHFDLIAVDIFVDDEVPEKFEQKEFLVKVKDLLSENGILLYNRIAGKKFQKKKSMDFFNKEFKGIFSSSRMLQLNKNIMLVYNNEK